MHSTICLGLDIASSAYCTRIYRLSGIVANNSVAYQQKINYANSKFALFTLVCVCVCVLVENELLCRSHTHILNWIANYLSLTFVLLVGTTVKQGSF